MQDPRNQLAQLLQEPAPVTMPPRRNTYTPTQTQYANGGAGGSVATPLIGGGLSLLGKGSAKTAASQAPTLWPQLNNAAFMSGQGPGQIMWSQGMPGSAEGLFNGGAWLGGGGGAGLDMFGAGSDAAAFNGGAWLGGDAALTGAAGGGALAGIGGAGAAEGIGATIAANPELLLLLA